MMKAEATIVASRPPRERNESTNHRACLELVRSIAPTVDRQSGAFPLSSTAALTADFQAARVSCDGAEFLLPLDFQKQFVANGRLNSGWSQGAQRCCAIWQDRKIEILV